MIAILRLVLLALILSQYADAQTFGTNEGTSRFLGKNTYEDVKARNTKVFASLEADGGEVSITINMKDFYFANALMQKSFGEDYLEIAKYPSAFFRGRISKTVNFGKQGNYDVTVEGRITLHGISKPLAFVGSIEVQNRKVIFEGTFKITSADFKIDAPKLAFQKMFESVTISNYFELEAQ